MCCCWWVGGITWTVGWEHFASAAQAPGGVSRVVYARTNAALPAQGQLRGGYGGRVPRRSEGHGVELNDAHARTHTRTHARTQKGRRKSGSYWSDEGSLRCTLLRYADRCRLPTPSGRWA